MKNGSQMKKIDVAIPCKNINNALNKHLFKVSRTLGVVLIISHSFLISLTVSLCGQVGGWYSQEQTR